jgi:hypothetical protein
MALARVYRTAVAALLCAYGVLLCWRPLQPSDDVWAHAAVGSWIWDHAALPPDTLFLWPSSIPWVYHSWLSALTFYGLASLPFDQTAILAFTCLVGLAPLVLVLWTWQGRDSTWVAVPGVWMLNGLVYRIQPRPDLFTSLALTALLLLLSRFPGRARWTWLVGFLALFAVWANFHGAVIIGLLLLGITIVCDAVQDRDWRRTRAQGLLLLAALVGTHLNPYGFGYWRSLAPLNSYTFSVILEWRPVWEEPPLPWDALVGAAVAGALAGAAWALSPKRRLAQLAWLLIAAALFVTARRNVSVFILVSAVVAALNAQALESQLLWGLLPRRGSGGEPRPVPLRRLLRLGILCYLVAEISVFVVTALEPAPVIGLPDGCVAFVRGHRVRGRVLNDLDNSAYFHWRFRNDLPLFIDGLNAYPDQLMRDYMTIVRGDRAAKDVIDGYDINIILLTVNRHGSLARLAYNLDRSPEWARVYVGGDAVIWVRRRDFAPLIEAVGPVNAVPFGTLETWHGVAR